MIVVNREVGIQNHLIGSFGENMVSAILNSWGISTIPTGDSDYGEDLICDILVGSDSKNRILKTNLTFRVQVKTTEDNLQKSYIRDLGDKFAISIKTNTLKRWLNSYFPVVVVIWDQEISEGFWCIPNEKNIDLKSQQSTNTIYFYKENKFKESEDKIKDSIRSYYNNLLKLSDSKYSCEIIPFYMPNYKMINKIDYPKDLSKNIVYLNFAFLPSHIASYNFLNIFDNSIYGIRVEKKSDSLEDFIKEIEKTIKKFCNINLKEKEWISFLVSPINIITLQEEKLSTKMTNWSSYSLIEDNLVTDYNYTFPIYSQKFKENYHYTQKIRSFSLDNNYFIHKSGKFAVEIFATTKESIFNIKMKENIIEKYKYNLCLLDISTCREKEKENLFEWCDKEGHACYYVEDMSGVMVIANPMFKIGDYGTLISFPLNWDEKNKKSYSSKKFIESIPTGEIVSKNILNKFYKNYLNIDMNKLKDDECVFSFEDMHMGFLMNHEKRNVVFTFYAENYKSDLEDIILKMANEIENNNRHIKELRLEYKLFQNNIMEIYLIIVPNYNVSSEKAISKTECIFWDIIDNILAYLDKENISMADMIKYRGQRYFPSEFIKEDKRLI